jgi:hypothetical protein
MRTSLLLSLVAGCLLFSGCTIGVPLWPLMLVDQPAVTSTNTCPVPLTLPVADRDVVAR